MDGRPLDGSTLDVRFLAGETPFTILGLPLDADTATVRRRVEELQLLARLEGDAGAERVARYREAANALQEPLRRLGAELFSPWAGTPAYADLAGAHDTALATTTSLLTAPARDLATSASIEAAVAAIEAWGALCTTPAVLERIDARAAVLRARPPTGWLGAAVGWALATLVQRLPASLPEQSEAIALLGAPAGALGGRLDAAVARGGALVILGVVREVVPSGGVALPRVRAQLPAAFGIVAALERVAPTECAAVRSDLARATLNVARDAYARDDLAAAEEVLAALVVEHLDPADRVEADRELAVLREAIARREAAALDAAPARPGRGALPRPELEQPVRPTGAGRPRRLRLAIAGGVLAIGIAVLGGVVVVRPQWLGIGAGSAQAGTADRDREAIERARASLEKQADDLLAMEAAVDTLRRQLQGGRPPASAGAAALQQYERDAARYNELAAKLRTATEAYNAAEVAFNRQVAAYNDRFRK